VPPMPHSPAFSSAMSFERQDEMAPPSSSSGQPRPPFFFRDEFSSLIVKGNFMTLAAKPKLVEEGEWLAHQGMSVSACWVTNAETCNTVVEQYRLLEQMIDVIKVQDDRGKPLCNPDTCPTMSASG
jgi:hypothetical protein